MLIKELKSQTQINYFLDKIISNQVGFEKRLDKRHRNQNGVFLTSSVTTIDNLLDVIKIDEEIFSKKILEPSCGQGAFLLKLIANIYTKFPDDKLISGFIQNCLFFVDVDQAMIEKTIANISTLYLYLFDEAYYGSFHGLNLDFTNKRIAKDLFDQSVATPFTELYGLFDYVIGNPPYVTLYGRRDKKENEEQRVNYLKNYNQFPDYVKNGKINLVMLFLEHSLDFLKQGGRLSFIIDLAFFETAYEHTRKYLLERTLIDELQVNIRDFEVASGQVILKITKGKAAQEHKVKISDWKTQSTYHVLQSSWFNKNDEYKFRYNHCGKAKQIIEKINAKKDNTILELFPNKNLRTCVMLLDMEEKFTFYNVTDKNEALVFPYYQGSKALSEKYGELNYSKYFYYNKPLQDEINEELKRQLGAEGIKNKKRLGLGETEIYENPKIFIRQSAKEIIASIDLKRSSANNSLYLFSLRNNKPETIEFLYFLCGWLNTDLVTYYAQQMNIIRYSQGKQPQIKISDLGTISMPTGKTIQNKFAELCKQIYEDTSMRSELSQRMDALIYQYYGLSKQEIETISESIKSF